MKKITIFVFLLLSNVSFSKEINAFEPEVTNQEETTPAPSMIIGLFDSDVSNDKIFEAITPAFQTIIGGFIGLITGIKIGQDSNDV